MRIVILTHSLDRHYYFCNQIIEKAGKVVGVITGAKVVNKSRYEKILSTIKKKEIKYYLKNKFLNMVFKEYGKRFQKEKLLAEKQFFGGATEHFNNNHKKLLIESLSPKYRSINDDYYVSLIRENNPDIIVVMGTCLIGKKIISSAKFVINLHTGLSPYYRGGNTNLWPIIEEEFGYFGVTIHLMSLGIDSGNIIFTERPEVCENDNYGTINSKSIIIGTDLMAQSIKLIENDDINSVKQWTKGKLFFNRDWDNYAAYKYFKKREKFLSMYCKLFEKNQLPKVKLIKNGREI